MKRKIEAMYSVYGTGIGICAECPHFRKKIFDRTYHKCTVYGDSNCEATDWRKNWKACGLIDKPFPSGDRRIVETIIAQREEDKPIEWQVSFI